MDGADLHRVRVAHLEHRHEVRQGDAGVDDKIIALGCKASLAVKPNTDIEAVYPYLDKLSMVLVMTVEPGFGGQSFMENTSQALETGYLYEI